MVEKAGGDAPRIVVVGVGEQAVAAAHALCDAGGIRDWALFVQHGAAAGADLAVVALWWPASSLLAWYTRSESDASHCAEPLCRSAALVYDDAVKVPTPIPVMR